LDETTERTQAELLKLSEALLICQQELAQLRRQQEGWGEEISRLRIENTGLANRSSRLAGAMATFLADAYWRGRGRIPPVSLGTFMASRWPRVRKLFGRKPPPETVTEMEQVRLIEASPAFDARWYLEHRPDVAAAGVHPALHYLHNGGPEGIDPGPDFDTRAYRRAHPDLGSDVNPLLHSLQSRDA
jgi:hypothetical protein